MEAGHAPKLGLAEVPGFPLLTVFVGGHGLAAPVVMTEP
jgi:hypothetical protein